MREQVRDFGRLEHFSQAIQNIQNYTQGMSMEQLSSSHILVHDYYQVNMQIMWDVISNDIPQLEKQIQTYMNE